MKGITIAVAAIVSLGASTLPAMCQSQTGDTTFEKKSYNYAEWAKVNRSGFIGGYLV